MNSCPSSRQRLFLGLFPLFLFVGLAAMAQQPADDKSKTDILRAGVNGVGMPRCEYCPDPEYSKEAKKKKYEGVVVLLAVVTTEGKATNINVAKSPELGLDEKAIEAVRKWRFKPAMKDGKPVPAQVPIEVTFRFAH
jgi:TonB family protein